MRWSNARWRRCRASAYGSLVLGMTSPAVYARALHQAWQETPEAQRSALLERFLGQLQTDGAIDLTSAIVRELQCVEDDAAADAAVTVVTARPLPPSTLASVVSAVRPLLPAAAATPRTQIVPPVVGGFMVRTPTLEVDASVHRMLARLRE